MSRTPTDWESSKGLAKSILRDRKTRRQWMARWLMFTLAWMVVGLWVVDGWLEQEVIRFVIWWVFCGFLAVVLMIFALYDSVSVVREEREKR